MRLCLRLRYKIYKAARHERAWKPSVLCLQTTSPPHVSTYVNVDVINLFKLKLHLSQGRVRLQSINCHSHGRRSEVAKALAKGLDWRH